MVLLNQANYPPPEYLQTIAHPPPYPPYFSGYPRKKANNREQPEAKNP